MRFQNDLYPTLPEQMTAMAEPGPEGPIVMVNLLKFKDKAVYEDGRTTELSGREAYMIYGKAVAELVQKHGGRILFAGDVTHLTLGQVEPLWDEIALAEYPRRRDMVEMSMSAAWREISVHRTAGLAGQLNIETTHMANTITLTTPQAK